MEHVELRFDYNGRPRLPSNEFGDGAADQCPPQELFDPQICIGSLQSLSHLEPPVDSVYMIFGVLIAMALVGAIIVLLAVTISKLRKREDHSNSVHPEPAVVQTAAAPVPASASPSANGTLQSCDAMPPHCTDFGPSSDPELASYAGQIVWQFPPPYPPPHTPPPQYSLYNNDQDTLVHALPSERVGFAKGFRKNLGGRWRRLVKRKPEMEACSIPPELKDQLKTIYVY
ncbi:uncharacterized protein LOC105692096 isoform X4 [Athalia rosae]|uniref:uncharacterized protein LOC105692096 isoform X4 n=1 Tax=Athalia rosae TaxID=37344 RepID=UPI0020348EAA|nr:uncharacterized protein LOC105692096 isoform X4 [Athalia rosae]